jgi:3-hydroxybutyrate dehydrogenase
MRLANKVAIVTGAGRGMGRAISIQFAQEGADLAAVEVNADSLREVAEEVRERGRKCLPIQADLSKLPDIDAMVTGALEEFGKIDILVNNAGIQHVAPIESFPPEKWDAILALNLSAAFHAIRATFADMKARGWGRIINVASAHGLVASPFKSAYVAAKNGIIGLTKTVALEGAEFGITANAICPGYVWTPLVEQQIEDQAKSHGIPRDRVIKEVLLAKQPTRKFAETSEIGALAVFLATDAAQSITGTALPVDGGWTAH